MANPDKPAPAAPVATAEKPVAPVHVPVIKPIKAKVHEKVKPQTNEQLEQAMVWYGSKPKCPFVNFGVGGVCFASRVGQFKSGPHGGPDSENSYDGNYHLLTRAHMNQIVADVSKMVFRMGIRPEIWDVTSNDYHQDPLDQPVGRFLYMVEIPEGVPFDRSAERAPSMVE